MFGDEIQGEYVQVGEYQLGFDLLLVLVEVGLWGQVVGEVVFVVERDDLIWVVFSW